MEDTLERKKTRVQWFLGNQCNYKCSYCSDIFHKADKPFPPHDLIVEVGLEIIYHYDDLNRDVFFEFLGGEPTLAGDIGEIGRRLHNRPVNFSLKTNGSADLEYWQRNRNFLSEVVISAHKEFCDLDHIAQVIQILKDEELGPPINVKLLIPTTHDPVHFSWARQTLARFRKNYDLGDIQMLFSNFAQGSDMYYPYTNEQWRSYYSSKGMPSPAPKTVEQDPIVNRNDKTHQVWVQKNAKEPPPMVNPEPEVKRVIPKIRHPLDYRDFSCHAGLDTLVIDNAGDVWRGWCNQGDKLGNIYQLPVAWPRSPIVCKKELCTNGFDQQAKKIRLL